MTTYTPFLKFKQNEMSACYEYLRGRNTPIVPFFDIPKPKESNETEIVDRLRIGMKQLAKTLTNTSFYIDNFDVDDSILLAGSEQYRYILNSLSQFNAIPVMALNRCADHNVAAHDFLKKRPTVVAVRLTTEDIESYKLTKPDLTLLWAMIADTEVVEIHVIFDFRVIAGEISNLAKAAAKFLIALAQDFPFHKAIITGSTIPAVITNLAKPNSGIEFERNEWHLWQAIALLLPKELMHIVNYGDYGIVSPDYTDNEFEFWLVQSVAAPKVFYTFSTKSFVIRGGAFKSHPKGYKQYFDIADTITGKAFFRGKNYSTGEKYIYERSCFSTPKAAKGGSPSTWLKASLTSHLTFIVDCL